MSRKGSDLPNPTIEVSGMKFSTYIGVAAAMWLEESLGCSITEVGDRLSKITDADLDMKFVTKILIALYLQANLDDDPEVAKKKVRGLSLDQMGDVLSRMKAASFEPKDGAPVPLIENKAKTKAAT